jgi:uncharacterized protein (TIGR00290 family)
MIHAVAWSGGKDSMLALDRAVRQDLDVRYLLNIIDAGTRRIRFHGVRAELIGRQAAALRMQLLQPATLPENFEQTFLGGLDQLRDFGVEGIIFGNIHLEDVRGWYEERTTGRGLAHVEPLWKVDPNVAVAELLERGYRTRITSVDLQMADRGWLGRELDRALAAEIAGRKGVDAAGERGEYHTFVFAGPLFTEPVEHIVGPVREEKGHALIEIV